MGYGNFETGVRTWLRALESENVEIHADETSVTLTHAGRPVVGADAEMAHAYDF